MSLLYKRQIFIVTLSFLLISNCSSSGSDLQSSQVDVIRVIDGDTVVISNNQRVRLIGIDTPEKGQCGFDEAKQALEKLLSLGSATFYTDRKSTIGYFDISKSRKLTSASN